MIWFNDRINDSRSVSFRVGVCLYLTWNVSDAGTLTGVGADEVT